MPKPPKVPPALASSLLLTSNFSVSPASAFCFEVLQAQAPVLQISPMSDTSKFDHELTAMHHTQRTTRFMWRLTESLCSVSCCVL
jgi:hypothetical protein